MLDDFWRQYWQHSHKLDSEDRQLQVARSRSGLPIDEATWKLTVQHVLDSFTLGENAIVLDACGGNGLVSRAFAPFCKEIYIVDINFDLLSRVEKTTGRIHIIHEDLLEFLSGCDIKFDAIIFYAAIQYFTEVEVFQIIRHFLRILPLGGQIFIGDIPSLAKRDSYLATGTQFKNYFDNLSMEMPTIGSWFTYEWLKELAFYLGARHCKFLQQPTYQIYSDFRFDVLIEK